MRKITVLAAVFLVLCIVLILLMRSCGGERGKEEVASFTPSTALSIPTADPAPLVVETPEPTPSYAGAIWTTDTVRLRRANSTDSDIIAEVPPNTQLERTGLTGNGWSIVEYIGMTCYVSSDYVTTTPPVELSAGEGGGTGTNITPVSDTVWTTEGVNLRRGPGTNFEVGESLVGSGIELKRTGITDNNWSRVIYKSVGYFVSSDYITTVQPTPDPDAIAPPVTEAPIATPTVAEGKTEGEFRSDTGVHLNVLVRWTVEKLDNGTYDLSLSVYLLSCRLDPLAQNPDDVCISVGPSTLYCTSGLKEVDSDNEVETLLASKTVNVKDSTIPVSVSWSFNGTYSGVKLDKIEAMDTLVFPQ